MAGRRAAGVAGFSATAALAPSSGCGRACGGGGGTASAWTMSRLAARLDVAGRPARRAARPSGAPRTARRCGRQAAIRSGPNVRFGTNWPSITSHWMRSTPAASSAATRRRAGRSRRAAPTGRSRSARSVPGELMGESTDMARNQPGVRRARPSVASAASASSTSCGGGPARTGWRRGRAPTGRCRRPAPAAWR